MATPTYTNELIHETSPYLLQHAHNPVNWLPWGEQALQLAKQENKLILISVGYAACHWCHVMAHESFEDPEVAQVMNEHFVCIKVDREERPDVDQLYMTAVQLMPQQGGWPLNAIALPDGQPIWGGTYFQKEVWTNALLQIHAYHQQNPEKTAEYAERLSQGIQESSLVPILKESEALSISQLEQAVDRWKSSFDKQEGGHRGAPKFMLPNNLQFLLRWAHQTHDNDTLKYVETSLNKMAWGGIFDQIGGGFARYSTDSFWKVPHFEKMLYDNGQLLQIYAQAFQKTGNELYQEVIEQTVGFLKRELLSSENGFYSSLDADSEGEEGKFYVWQKRELQELLNGDWPLFSAYYQVNENGHWENGNYILLRKTSDEDFAQQHQLEVPELKKRVTNWRNQLLNVRAKRIRPGLDDKILTSWNALTLSGLLAAYRALGAKEYLDLAEQNARFLQQNLQSSDGSIHHSFKNGISKIDGFLEDYAFLTQAWLDFYETTGAEEWLISAQKLTDYTLRHFFDQEKGFFYFTGDEQTDLLHRNIEIHDNVTPASNSVMANNLFRLGHHLGQNQLLKTAEQMLEKLANDFSHYPSGFSNWMNLAINFVQPYFEVAISGSEASKKLQEIQASYLPNCLFNASATESQLPLLNNRWSDKTTRIFVCQDKACQSPTEEVAIALQQIEGS